MNAMLRSAAAVALVGAVAGCASFKPAPASYQPHRERALVQTNGPITVSVAVPSRKEAEKIFGLPLRKKRIQPVWLRLENRGTNQYYFLPASLDPNYYSPAEVAYIYRKWYAPWRNRRVSDFMESKRIEIRIPPDGVVEGFVFANYDPGAKHVLVDLLAEMEFRRLEFSVPVPGRRYDIDKVDFEKLYPPDAVKDYTLEALRPVLEDLPAATTNAKGKGSGDPINLIVVGRLEDLDLAFRRQGWDLTETLTPGSALRLVGAFLFSSPWRTSPVSPLYVFERRQDFALQKARSTIHERNHLRLWLAPFTCEGRMVAVGQISRDIGIRFTTRTPGFVTHKIDPDVDEARNYVTQEMLTSGSVYQVAWVRGVGKAPRHQPRRNLTGDPYYTDGYRVVLFLSSEPVAASKVHFIDWTKSAEQSEPGENPE